MSISLGCRSEFAGDLRGWEEKRDTPASLLSEALPPAPLPHVLRRKLSKRNWSSEGAGP